MNEELQNVFQAVTTFVNCVKGSLLTGRLMTVMWRYGDRTHCYVTSWLSRTKVHHKVFEFEQGVAIFVSGINNIYGENLLHNEDFIQQLV